MTSEPIVLDYGMTRDDMYAYFVRQASPFKTPLFRRFGGCLLIGFALWSWNENGWLLNLLTLVFAGHFLFFPRWLIWLMSLMRLRSGWPIPCRIEIDAQGVRYQQLDSKSPSKPYCWSRLSATKPDELGIELQFDRPWEGPFIPWKAFPDNQQRQAFLDLVKRHLDVSPRRQVIDG